MESEPRVEVQRGRTRTVPQEGKEEAGLYIAKDTPAEVGHTAIHVLEGWEGVLDLDMGRMEMVVVDDMLITQRCQLGNLCGEKFTPEVVTEIFPLWSNMFDRPDIVERFLPVPEELVEPEGVCQ